MARPATVPDPSPKAANLGTRPWGISPLPDVIAGRCVHTRVEQASCRACVDSCPCHAWVIDDRQLGIDTDRCDGCGLCAPACPEGAIRGRWRVATYALAGDARDQRIGFLRCAVAPGGPPEQPKAAAAPAAGLVHCLGAIGLADLLILHRHGMRRLIISHGDCCRCELQGGSRFEHALTDANRLIIDRDAEPIRLQRLDAVGWQKARELSAGADAQRRLSRRTLLRRPVALASDGLHRIHRLAEDPEAPVEPPGRRLARTRADQLAIRVPAIDPELCNACNACARLCAHGAIREHPGDYRIDADACTGCRICTDICTTGAVSLQAMAPPVQFQSLVPLRTDRCGSCGADYRHPAARPELAGRCAICRESGQRQRLYQVLDPPAAAGPTGLPDKPPTAQYKGNPPDPTTEEPPMNQHRRRAAHPKLALASALAATAGSALAEGTPPPPAPMTVQDAMSAMTGMAGEFRRTPDGEMILYPSVSVDEADAETHPGALVNPVGMSGMQSSTEEMEGMSTMGGQRGYFRIAPNGEVFFYPYPGDPIGMSGMSGMGGMSGGSESEQ